MEAMEQPEALLPVGPSCTFQKKANAQIAQHPFVSTGQTFLNTKKSIQIKHILIAMPVDMVARFKIEVLMTRYCASNSDSLR